jgi:hypothetical protein
MKRFTRILAAVALVAAFATNQAFAQNMRAGAKLGVDFANFGGDVEGTDSKTGFSAGAFFGVDLHDYFRLQFEGQYVQKGMKESVEGIELKWQLNYLELLVPATLTIPLQNSSITPRLYAGPAVGFEMKCELAASAQGQSQTVDCDQVGELTGGELAIQTKSPDFGFFFGGGVDVGLGNGAITFDILYNIGLTNINDIPGAEMVDIKNKNLQILLGYAFRLGS